jgi:hypothetical protein
VLYALKPVVSDRCRAQLDEALNELRRSLAMADTSLDLLLFSEREVAERLHWRSHVIARAA